jgi:hypothetical protein
MAKNAKQTAEDDSAKVTEEDLRKDKEAAEVESSKEQDETAADETSEEESEETSEGDGKTGDQTEEEESEESDQTESDEDTSEFVKEFPNIKGDTLEDYAREMEKTLHLSNAEGKRLSDELKANTSTTTKTDESEEDSGPVDPRLLYVDRLVNNDAQKAFTEFKKTYPQADDPAEYAKFESEVAALSGYYISRKQMLTAEELYPRVASILGWDPATDRVNSNDKLGIALKNKAAVSKTSSSAKQVKKSKVTDAMLAFNRLAYPNKTDEEIRKELEPYVK